jgi:hypothetical protein
MSEATLAFAAPVPRDKLNPKEVSPVDKKEVGLVEIDFSPLPSLKGEVDYRLKLLIKFENVKGTTEAKYKIGAGADSDTIINLIQTSLPMVEMEQVGAKLIVKGYEGHRVLKVEVQVEGIPKKHTPTVRRLPDEKKPKPKEVGPVEIDFSPLPKEAPVDYRLKLSIVCEGNTGLDLTTYKIGARTSPGGILSLVLISLPDGFDAKSVGSNRLVVKGYKGNQVVKVDVKVEGIPKKHTPTVRRLPQKKK